MSKHYPPLPRRRSIYCQRCPASAERQQNRLPLASKSNCQWRFPCPPPAARHASSQLLSKTSELATSDQALHMRRACTGKRICTYSYIFPTSQPDKMTKCNRSPDPETQRHTESRAQKSRNQKDAIPHKQTHSLDRFQDQKDCLNCMAESLEH